MKYSSSENPNQLSADLTGCGTGLSSWISCDSSSRLVMLGSHLSQMLVMEGSTPRQNITGVEADYANATFKAEMPVTGRILAVIPKFRAGYGKDQIDARSNPETVVIYENLEAKERGRLELGALTLTSHHCTHPEFGFKFKQLSTIRHLAVNEIIPKGTRFTESPNVQPNGDYAYGIQANVALMSIHPVIEDGIVISKSFAEKGAVTAIGSRMITWGKKRYPLNVYGDAENYKPFPDIGDRVREDGLLFALRDYDDILACTDMTNEALMQHDVIFDKLFYAPPGAEIINITIMKDDKAVPITPDSMLGQIRKYENAQKLYYSQINRTLSEYRKKNRLSKVNLSPELHRLAVEAIREEGGLSSNVVKTFRASPLDEWSIEITFAHRQVPNVSFKFTDTHGGKGVVVTVWDDERMPVDQWGNRADIIMDGDSTIKRMNVGRVYEQYVSAVSDQIHRQVKQMVESKVPEKDIWNLLTTYYTDASPMMGQLVNERLSPFPEKRQSHIESVCKEGVYLWLPTNSPNIGEQQIRELRAKYPVPKGPVTYIGESGRKVTTESDILIGSMYIILLEKTGSDWAAISSARRQHFGLLAKLTNGDKYSMPWREQPVRFLGEAEVRLLAAAVGPEITADLLEIPNSPAASKEIARKILSVTKPTDIDIVLNRKDVPRGISRSVMFVKHILACSGFEFTNE